MLINRKIKKQNYKYVLGLLVGFLFFLAYGIGWFQQPELVYACILPGECTPGSGSDQGCGAFGCPSGTRRVCTCERCPGCCPSAGTWSCQCITDPTCVPPVNCGNGTCTAEENPCNCIVDCPGTCGGGSGCVVYASSPPILLSPANGSVITYTDTNLSFYLNSFWGDPCTGYTRTTTTFLKQKSGGTCGAFAGSDIVDNKFYSDDTEQTVTIPVSGLISGSTYCWRVQRYNGVAGTESYSPTWEFSVCNASNPGSPALSSPTNGAVLNTNNVTLNWSDGGTSWGEGCPSVNQYEVYYAKKTGPSCPVTSGVEYLLAPGNPFSSLSTNTTLSGLEWGSTYCWFTRKDNNGGSPSVTSNGGYNQPDITPWEFTITRIPTMGVGGVANDVCGNGISGQDSEALASNPIDYVVRAQNKEATDTYSEVWVALVPSSLLSSAKASESTVNALSANAVIAKIVNASGSPSIQIVSAPNSSVVMPSNPVIAGNNIDGTFRITFNDSFVNGTYNVYGAALVTKPGGEQVTTGADQTYGTRVYTLLSSWIVDTIDPTASIAGPIYNPDGTFNINWTFTDTSGINSGAMLPRGTVKSDKAASSIRRNIQTPAYTVVFASPGTEYDIGVPSTTQTNFAQNYTDLTQALLARYTFTLRAQDNACNQRTVTKTASPVSPWLTAHNGSISGAKVDYSITSQQNFYLPFPDGTTELNMIFGTAGYLPIAGDWNNDGVDTIGSYNQTTGTFYLRNTNNTGFADATIVISGAPTGNRVFPVVGDWDNNGSDSVGVYNQVNANFYLSNTSTSSGSAPINFQLQLGGSNNNWLPVGGNWNATPGDRIGLYNPATGTFYLRNTLSTGFADYTFSLGAANYKPFAGDWDGNGRDSAGVYDPITSTFYTRNALSTGFADYTIVYKTPDTNFAPLAGDWGKNGITSIGIYRTTDARFFLKNIEDKSRGATYTFVSGSPGLDPSRMSKYSIYDYDYVNNAANPPAGFTTKYQYLLDTVNKNTNNAVVDSAATAINAGNITSAGGSADAKVYRRFTGNLTLNSGVICNAKGIYFVAGALTVNPDFTISGASDNGCMFIVLGNVTVNGGTLKTNTATSSDVPSNYDKLEMVIISDGLFSAPADGALGGPNKLDGLYIYGSVHATSVSLGRDLNFNANTNQPAIIFKFDARYRETFKSDLSSRNYSIRELK